MLQWLQPGDNPNKRGNREGCTAAVAARRAAPYVWQWWGCTTGVAADGAAPIGWQPLKWGCTNGPGFGCRIRTEPVSDPNPNLRRRIRSESEPGPAEPIRIRTWPGGTDPNPNPECRNRSESELGKINRTRTPNPDQTPPNASHLTVAGRDWDSD